MRIVKFEFDANILEEIEVQTGRDALHQAIGYLSQWGSGSDRYADVCLYAFASVRLGIEIVASYRSEPGGSPNYQIVAVWHPDSADTRSTAGHFGFHS